MNTRKYQMVTDIFNAALDSVNPYGTVKKYSDHIRSIYTSGEFKKLMVLSFGKAASRMAAALEDSVGDLIDSGVLITKYGHVENYRPKRLDIFEAGHPVPDHNGINATKETLKLLKGADIHTLVVCLISGGGSALLVAPSEGINLKDKQEITEALLSAGADINEVNCVRKKISSVKGGKLLCAAYPAKVISLIVSDVVGDCLGSIASGPTVVDTTTFKDALAVIKKYSLEPAENVLNVIMKGVLEEDNAEKNKSSDSCSDVDNIIIANNRSALEAAKRQGETLGFKTQIVTSTLSGEARESARWLAELALRIKKKPVCLISGGETTVTVSGNGIGGRNTEFALAFALQIKGFENITLLSAGTDGTDGPTDATGAIVDGNTVLKAAELNLQPINYLNDNDTYTFFSKVGGLLKTGPTGTNVMDVQVILITDND